jgi:hypothetical protein
MRFSPVFHLRPGCIDTVETGQRVCVITVDEGTDADFGVLKKKLTPEIFSPALTPRNFIA